MSIKILPEILEIKDQLICHRRHFHKYPELGFDVHETAAFIAKRLKSYKIDVKTNIGQTGVVGELYGKHDGKTIALRADMDALPIQETGNFSYKSKNAGVMHACGHDGHMAMVLSAAEILSQKREQLHGNVRFIFQPAEEGGGGARYMIKDGCLDGVDEIYGAHLWNYQSLGEIGIAAGAVMSAADIFNITINGKGGHGAAPQGTVDAIVAAAQLIVNLQSIVSRNLNPLENGVLTIGKIEGGHGFNVISDKVKMQGTIRAMTETNRQMLKTRLYEIIDGAEKTSGAKIDVEYQDGYPPTINHAKCVKTVKKVAGKIVGDGVVEPYLTMGAEDFSYYLQKIPGCFFFIGSAPDDENPMSVPHHCSHFNINEQALLIGTSVFVQLIMDQLSTDY